MIKNVFISLFVFVCIGALGTGVYKYYESGSSDKGTVPLNGNSSPKELQLAPVAGMKYYVDSNLGFFFLYPDYFEIQKQDTISGHLVVISSSTIGQSIQLQTRGWNDAEQVVTVERVRHDSPFVDIRNAQQLNIAGRLAGVIFTSTSPDVEGDIIQAWFIVDKQLYQFTAPSNSVSLLNAILISFKLLE